MTRRRHAATEGESTETDTTEGSTHEHWETVEKLAPLAAGQCRCTSIEHKRGEPGCEAGHGGD